METEYITTGDLARMRGVPLSRVTYAMQRCGIREDARAGICRLFRRSRLDELLAAIDRIGHVQTEVSRCR